MLCNIFVFAKFCLNVLLPANDPFANEPVLSNEELNNGPRLETPEVGIRVANVKEKIP